MFLVKGAAITVFLVAVFSSATAAENCTTQQHRLRYHYSPSRNWCNDPNGMVYYDGLFHLFFQHHPYSTQWGDMHWGHAISRDLISWEELPIALYPDHLGTIYSGSCVVDKTNSSGFKQPGSTVDPVVAIYTSAGDGQRQSIAVSLDKGMTFSKYENNPVLSNPAQPDFRDPKVILVNGTWIMVLAVWDRIDIYSSPNLIDWTLESEFGRDPWEGAHDGIWECPDLIELEVDGVKRWVLIISVSGGAPNTGNGIFYVIGDLTRNADNKVVFRPLNGWDRTQWLDWGPDNYAGVTFSNMPGNRSVYMSWMVNGNYAGDIPTSTWRGQFTIPRELSLRRINDNLIRVVTSPARELEGLRNHDQYLEVTQEFRLPSQTRVDLTERANFTTPLMELSITVSITNAAKFSICAYNSVEEETCFGFNGNEWSVDRSRSGNVNFHDNFGRMLNLRAERTDHAEEQTVRLFLDTSVLEVFADNGLATMTALHFPSRPFDKFYIRNLETPSSDARLIVKRFQIWGLDCWYPEIPN